MAYSLYLITNKQHTYVGITNNLEKRLRQHNGDIKGGSRHTRIIGPGWTYATIVSGLNKSNALSFEYKVKHPLCRGYDERQNRIIHLYNTEFSTAQLQLKIYKND